MHRRARRVKRRILIGLLTIPLLQATSCLDITQRVVVNSFFDALIPALDAQLQADLGTDGSGP